VSDAAALRPVTAPPVTEAGAALTARELEVLRLMANGLGNKEIAQRLNLAAHTVKNYVGHILEKLALHSRLQLAAFAHKAGNWRRRGGGRHRTDE